MPACRPALPFVSSMKRGGPQVAACLQLITPDPCSPPTMNPAFFRSGMTTTHRALFQIESGIPLSGAFLISVSTVAASFNFSMSVFFSCANADIAMMRTVAPATTVFVVRMLTSAGFKCNASTWWECVRYHRWRSAVEQRCPHIEIAATACGRSDERLRIAYLESPGSAVRYGTSSAHGVRNDEKCDERSCGEPR